jgi:hypothetical protein
MTGVLAGLAICLAWLSPWVTESFAAARAVYAFEKQWRHTQDGCGFHCKGCGVRNTEKVPFGRTVEIEFACGLLPSDSPEYHRTQTRFVSFLGTVH